MVSSSLPNLPNHNDIRQEAIAILVERMGMAKTAIFLGETFWQSTDYLTIKDELFAHETVDSLYDKILQWRQTHPEA